MGLLRKYFIVSLRLGLSKQGNQTPGLRDRLWKLNDDLHLSGAKFYLPVGMFTISKGDYTWSYHLHYKGFVYSNIKYSFLLERDLEPGIQFF